MASRSDQGAIPHKFDFVSKDVKVTKHTASTLNNNATSKVSMDVPIVPIGGSKSQCLYMLSRFRKAESILRWTNGATLYSVLTSKTNWRMHQSGIQSVTHSHNQSQGLEKRLMPTYFCYSQSMLGKHTGQWWSTGRNVSRNPPVSSCLGLASMTQS